MCELFRLREYGLQALRALRSLPRGKFEGEIFITLKHFANRSRRVVSRRFRAYSPRTFWNGVVMAMRAWIGCIIAVVVLALLLNDRPVTIAASDTPITLAASDTEVLISKSAPVSGYAGKTWAR
jgi:hypothetical protein